jgi:hypothetical protein
MNTYHYAVISRPESSMTQEKGSSVDMENVDYKRQPDPILIEATIESAGGICCGVIRGGMFGLRTNQVSVLSVWPEGTKAEVRFSDPEDAKQNLVSEEQLMVATVRPTSTEKINQPGIYVIRWIRIQPDDIEEYTSLCLKTWPAFETLSSARCYGVFRALENDCGVSKILMLTWYENLTDWESSRSLNPADSDKWARRSEMELSHWAEAGRLA